MDIKFSDFEDNDMGRQLAEMTKADYWEVQADMWHQNYKEATNEIERLRDNAKQDARYLAAYHRICQKHGFAPSSSELIETMKESE